MSNPRKRPFVSTQTAEDLKEQEQNPHKRLRLENVRENPTGFKTTEIYQYHHSDEGKEVRITSRRSISRSDEGMVVAKHEYQEQYQYSSFDPMSEPVNKYAFGESDFNDDGTPKEHARADFEAYKREHQLFAEPSQPATRDLTDFKKRNGNQKQYNDLEDKITHTQIFKKINRGNLHIDEKERLLREKLGRNVYTKDHKYFFERNDQATQYAKLFMQTFFEDDKCMQTFIKDQENRPARFHTNSKDPRCISFVFAYVNNQPICLVAISNTVQDIEGNPLYFNLINALQKTCDVILQKSGYQYFLAPPSSQNFNHLLNNLSKMNGWKTEDRIKGCAERAYTALITKILLNPQVDLQINSIINLAFFPFKLNLNYSDKTQHSRNGIDLLADHNFNYPAFEVIFQINGIEHRTHIKLNCDLCQKNYNAIMLTWMAAKEIAEQQKPQSSSAKSLEIKLPDQTPTASTPLSPLPKDISDFIARTYGQARMKLDSSANKPKPDREIEREERRKKELEAKKQERREESTMLKQEEPQRHEQMRSRGKSPKKPSPSRMYPQRSGLPTKVESDKDRLERLINERLRLL